jgi:signal transduction histidine kinase
MPRVASRTRSTDPLLTDTAGVRDARSAETELIVEMARSIHADADPHAMIERLAQNLIRLFTCSRILIAAREHERGRAFLWQAAGVAPHVHRSSLDRSEREAFFAPAPACWLAIRSRRTTEAGRFHIEYPGRARRLSSPRWSGFVSRSLDAVRPADGCLAIAFEFGPEWTCRVFLVDPAMSRPRRSVVRLAQRLVDALGPALYNVYVAERLRTAAADTERANLARALHDGVIQSLIAAEMEVHASCRRAMAGSTVPASELHKIRKILHDEVLGLRDLMLRIKPVQIQPDELCGALSDCVTKFKADTGIASSFGADVGQVSLPAAMCPPVVRIVQEALSNVRKHSGARSVQVSIKEANGHWLLIVEDDGRGLDPGAAARGPLVIRECVRSLDGELKMLPAAGGGLRLEITFTGYARSVSAPPAIRARLVAVEEQTRTSLRPRNTGASRGSRLTVCRTSAP